MKKIAYMITAYQSPKSLYNLIDALNNDYVDFYIHIDKKINIKMFDIYLKNFSNVYFLKGNERIKVYWGGYSQLRSQYNIIKKILDSNINYKKIVSLTGMDYPIVSNDEIFNKLLSPKQFIICFNLKNDLKQFDKVNKIHFMDAQD